MAGGTRRWGRWVLLGLAALVVVPVLAGEAYLRVAWKLPPHSERHVFVRPPLLRLRVTVGRDMPGLSRRSVRFTTNALGLRGDELDLADRSKKRVITLGDSVTECLLLDDAKSWPGRLQHLLTVKTGRAVWVGNAGSSGHLSLDCIAHMRVLVPLFAPDLVVVMPGGYDLQAAIEEKLLPMDLGDPKKLAAYAAKLYPKENLDDLEPSHLGYFLYGLMHPEALDMTRFYLRMRERRTAHPKLAEWDGIEDALDVYATNLRAIVTAWRSLSQRPHLLFVTSPSLWKAQMPEAEQRALWGGYTCMDCADPRYYGHAVLAASMRRFNQTLLDVCRSEGVPCLDLDRFVAKDLDHFYDDAHMKEAGAEITARRMAEFVASKRWWN